MTKVKLKT